MKILTTIIAIFVCFGFVNGFAVEKENVVLLYHFDSDTKAKAEDASPQKHAGTVTNGTWTKDGKFGGGMEFNGKSSVIEVPHHASLQPGGDKLTVAAVVQTQLISGRASTDRSKRLCSRERLGV